MRESLKQIALYRPPKTQGKIPLHLNTNRLGPNPVVCRVAELLQKIELNDYPDNEAQLLRRALADHYGLAPEWFLVGNGSDEVFDLIFKTFLNPDDLAAYTGPTYVMYPQYALINAARAVEVPLDEAFDLDAQALLTTSAELRVVCTPNNPTGNVLDPSVIEKVLRSSGRLTVIDEAYGEFANGDWLRYVREYANLLVTRTFSKAYGLAGLRVGYVAANPELIQQMERARLPYNLNALSQALAVAALQEQDFVREYVGLIRSERPQWTEALTARGFRVWPSQTNFLLTEVPTGVNRDALVARLATAGVLVRSTGSHPRLKRCLRITVGLPTDLDALLKALDQELP
jgi:histidinol-phosphate aminotransferase